jgi:hypothetical protein
LESSIDSTLARYYRENSKPVAFIDESFELERDRTFYIVGATVVNASDLNASRQELLEFYDGDALHAGPMYRRGEFATLEQATVLVSGQNDGCELVICTQIDEGDEHAEEARARCLSHLMSKLQRDFGVELFIVDAHHLPDKNRKDQDTARALRQKGLLTRDSTLHHTRPSMEPLLGLPDVLAWAYRQKHIRGDEKWFSPFSSYAEISTI